MCFLVLETPFPETSAQRLSEVPPALLADNSVSVSQGLVHTPVIFLLVGGDHHCKAQNQGSRGQPHGPAHAHLEQKETLELPGPLWGASFPPCTPPL